MVRTFALALKCASIGFLVCLLCLLIPASPALAQSASTGALSGTVTDPSGGVIVGATVTATSLATGQARSVTTDASGVYKISLLPPGNYSVKFSANGFKTVEVPSVTVNVTETHLLDHALEVGSSTQQVTVESTVETIQAQNATVGGLVSGQTVTELPLSTRNYTQVIDLSPGVVANVATATAVGNGTQDINVNGSGSDQNTYMMDGAVITNYGSGGAAQSGSYAGIGIPNPDSIQEFKVQTSQYDAAYGQNPGANVNVVTKSGTNQYHGAIWEFNRNNVFNANDFFFKNSERGEGLPNKPPEVKQNQFGGTFGGPIKKDKIFIFGSYQGLRQLNGIGSNGFATGITSVSLLPFNEPGVAFANARSDQGAGYTIPLDYGIQNPLNANFGSTTPGSIIGRPCDASTYRKYLGCAFGGENDFLSFLGFGTATPVANNGSNINQSFINLLKATESIPQVRGGFNNGYYVPSLRYNASGVPSCVATGSCASPTTISQATQANEDQYLLNTDYVLNRKHTFSEKYFFSKDPQTQSFSCLGGCYPGAPEDARYGSQSLVTKLTSVLTNNLVNEAFFSFQRLFLNVTDGVTVNSCDVNIIPAINNGVPCSANSPDKTVPNLEDRLIPVIGTFGFPGSNWGGWQLGGNFFSATHSIQNTFLGNEQISWNHGKHSIRAGFNIQRIQWNWSQPDRERGWINGGNTADLMTSSPSVPNGIFLNLTNRLLPAGSVNPHHWRINEYSTFVQDDVKLTRKLTVNLGLRWELDGWPSDNQGIFTNFAASAAGLVDTGSFFLNNPGGTLAGYIVQSNYNKALYNGLVGQFGSTGILVNSNKTLLQRPPIDNFSPRIGVAWQPFGSQFVVRAGYGMFFDRMYGNLLGDNILGNEPPYATGIGTAPGQTFQNPFCTPTTCPQFLGFIPRTLQVTAGDPVNGATAIADFFGGNGTGIITSGDNPAMRTPKVQQYNLDLQYEFAHGWVLDVGYVGTHGVHLFDWNRAPNLAYLVPGAPNGPTANDVVDQLMIKSASSFPMNDSANTNPSTQVLTNTASNVMGRVHYLGVAPSGLQQVETDGNHLYNSLQMQLRHQFSHGLTMQASYTWSKLITDVNASESGGGIATPGNVLSGSASMNDPLNFRQQYGLAAFNRPQRLVVNYNYDLPFKGEGWHNKVIGGWSVSGVTTIQDGTPFTVVDSSGGTLYYGSSLATGAIIRAQLANPGNCNSLGICKSGTPLNTSGSMKCRLGIVVLGGNGAPLPCDIVGGVVSPTGFINPGAFTGVPTFGGDTNPASGGPCPQEGFFDCGTGFGNSGVGIMKCCTQVNFDMGIIKDTKVGGIREDGSLQFRAEFYNLFNHTQYNPPANNRNSTTFGQITSSAVPGRILQFGLKYSF